MRKIILAALGIAAIVGAIFLGNYLIDKNQKPKPKFKKQIKTVFVEDVENKSIPIVLSASGNLTAKNKIEIYSEVSGVLKPSKKLFKAGSNYYRGETLLSLNSDEFYASIQSQKSNLYNLITSVLPDLRLDYPSEFPKWEKYLQGFDMNKTTPKIPEFSSDKERYFISGRGILTAYYNVKNLEVRLTKYQIRAPFSGILTEALVSPGSLVRVGQKLGEFIDPSVYEMEVSINAEFADLLKVGNSVALSNLEKTKDYTGKVVRVNGKVDQVSQTIKVFIDVKHTDLKEGMYLEANLVAKSETEAIEIPRKLLVDNSAVYTVKNDSVLTLSKIDPVYFGAETVVIKGLKNNDKLLSQTLPGAFDGMIVKINKK
ncbi:efflux transporter periplasmic adaptor subunit [Polaribacter reichenbachii]|uniref:Efflux transporter periplasmic adaptor subunit n=1 Tax=Polaribacter reichenbachii TaxID=996801 RepID=A0A1B8TVK3_9FLAO|nr:HlyD family efflux transporter periplasmic adaptor subunit [Polaribacter reichenbachii]APZ45362.1 efflux transporter periplasmic adaptor subunit [Polaribacter reichenbachii]AUC19223.1 efflux transporter periplasmic adaptor subunit [Polaribacter reichenbachii]OBY63620.1 efflux transporter periplasmic adaptor subunit [Polaribacter reichenbachii]